MRSLRKSRERVCWVRACDFIIYTIASHIDLLALVAVVFGGKRCLCFFFSSFVLLFGSPPTPFRHSYSLIHSLCSLALTLAVRYRFSIVCFRHKPYNVFYLLFTIWPIRKIRILLPNSHTHTHTGNESWQLSFAQLVNYVNIFEFIKSFHFQFVATAAAAVFVVFSSISLFLFSSTISPSSARFNSFNLYLIRKYEK